MRCTSGRYATPLHGQRMVILARREWLVPPYEFRYGYPHHIFPYLELPRFGLLGAIGTNSEQ